MALYMRKTVLLAKNEASYGTDAAPTGAANAILVSNITITPMQTDFAQRNLVRPFFGNSENLPAAVHALCEFEVEMAGSGTAGTAPAWGVLLRGCGFAETLTAGTSAAYDPVSGNFESLTLHINRDGVLHKLTGARGSLSMEINAKARPVFKFKFTALYNTVVDAALPTPDYTNFKTPVAANLANTPTVTLHGTTVKASGVTFDIANDVKFRALIGGESVEIADRKPTGQATFEAVSVAVKDWWTTARSATLGTLQIVHGTTAGNKIQIDAPKVQIQPPTYQDQDGVAMLQASLVLVPNAGNDEIRITAL